MAQVWFKNIVRFIFLVLFQVLVLNHINLGGYINPYFYIYFILLLPFATPKWLLLISSFFLGLSVDLFTHTPGLNAAACVLMGFTRPFVIGRISTGNEYQVGEQPSLRFQDVKWFSYYTVILVLIHHFTLFYLEVFRFREFFTTFLRFLLSSVFTILLVFLSEYLFYGRKK
jgi:hypothetical protein